MALLIYFLQTLLGSAMSVFGKLCSAAGELEPAAG